MCSVIIYNVFEECIACIIISLPCTVFIYSFLYKFYINFIFLGLSKGYLEMIHQMKAYIFPYRMVCTVRQADQKIIGMLQL